MDAGDGRAQTGTETVDSSRCSVSLLTKVDVEQGSVGTLHQDLLAGPGQRFVHEVHPVSHQRA